MLKNFWNKEVGGGEQEKYLEILVEERRPLRPSRVTTSKPILSAPSLTSPITLNSIQLNNKFSFTDSICAWIRKWVHTSVEALDL